MRLRKRRPHIQLNSRAVDPWLTIVAANGEPILHSETYSSLTAARRAAWVLGRDTGWSVEDVRV